MALQCLAEGLRQGREAGDRYNGLIAEWIALRYASADSSTVHTSDAWSELLKVGARALVSLPSNQCGHPKNRSARLSGFREPGVVP